MAAEAGYGTLAASVPSGGVDTGFDLGRGISRRSTPPEVVTLIKLFNRCYHAGHNAIVTVLIFICLVLSPFVGMAGGLVWVTVRVLLLPLIQPLGDIMRIVWGQEGSLWVEVQKLKIQSMERQFAMARPVRPGEQVAV